MCHSLIRVDSVVGGTSCVDFSSLKSCSKSGIVNEIKGNSSITFLGLLTYTEVHKPSWVCGENVENVLVAGSAFNELLPSFHPARFRIEALGYTVLWHLTSPEEACIPQSRRRLYYVCFRSMGGLWFVYVEAHLAMEVLATVFAQAPYDIDQPLFAVDGFKAEGIRASEPFTKEVTAPLVDTVKWPEGHAAWAAKNSIPYRSLMFVWFVGWFCVCLRGLYNMFACELGSSGCKL